jgi:TonB family protein
MKLLTCTSMIFAIAILSTVVAHAQVGGNATKHYEKDALAFDYPGGWKLTDSSSQGMQMVTLAPASGATQIIVRVLNHPTSSCDFQAERKKITNALAQKLATQIHAASPLRTSRVTTQVGTSEVDGAQLRGVISRKLVTGDVYSVRLNRRFVSLVYVRVDNDKLASSAWNTIRTTLKVEPAVMTVGATTASSADATITSGVLNGQAVRLPAPSYPAIARQAHASGTVTVQVTIDESGNVISANAIEGHPLLRAVSAAAARQAHFSPTKLCNEPVRVAGVITYNFVAR